MTNMNPNQSNSGELSTNHLFCYMRQNTSIERLEEVCLQSNWTAAMNKIQKNEALIDGMCNEAYLALDWLVTKFSLTVEDVYEANLIRVVFVEGNGNSVDKIRWLTDKFELSREYVRSCSKSIFVDGIKNRHWQAVKLLVDKFDLTKDDATPVAKEVVTKGVRRGEIEIVKQFVNKFDLSADVRGYANEVINEGIRKGAFENVKEFIDMFDLTVDNDIKKKLKRHNKMKDMCPGCGALSMAGPPEHDEHVMHEEYRCKCGQFYCSSAPVHGCIANSLEELYKCPVCTTSSSRIFNDSTLLVAVAEMMDKSIEELTEEVKLFQERKNGRSMPLIKGAVS